MLPLRPSASHQNFSTTTPAQRADGTGSRTQPSASTSTAPPLANTPDSSNLGVPHQPLQQKKSFVKSLRDKYLSSAREKSPAPSKTLRPSKSIADGLRQAFSSSKTAEKATASNMPDNAEVAEGRQVTKKRSFFRRGGTSTANRDTDVPAIPASAGEASKAAPSDAAKALQQLRTPREREHHADFEHVCDGISLQLNPATRLPNGNAKLQSTLEDWHAEVMRTIAAIESLQQAPEGAPAGAAEVRTQMYAAKSVTENMLKALKGDDNNINRAYFGRESTNLMVNISRNSEMHALAHLRIDKGHKTMHIEGLVSHPRNIFDLDGHGGVKGAARTALATIRSEAIKHGCSNIELKSLTGKSTTLYRNAGYEKDLDYWPDDDQPDMRLVLPRR